MTHPHHSLTYALHILVHRTLFSYTHWCPLLTIARKWKWPKCSSVGEWIMKTHTTKYYSAVEKKKYEISKWANLEQSMLQVQRDICVCSPSPALPSSRPPDLWVYNLEYPPKLRKYKETNSGSGGGWDGVETGIAGCRWHEFSNEKVRRILMLWQKGREVNTEGAGGRGINM